MRDVLHAAGQQIVGADHRVALRQQGIAQVGTEKARAAGHQYTHSLSSFSRIGSYRAAVRAVSDVYQDAQLLRRRAR